MDAARYGQLAGAGAGTKGRKHAVTNPAPTTIKRAFNILSDPARIREFQVACRSAPSKMAAMTPMDKRTPPSSYRVVYRTAIANREIFHQQNHSVKEHSSETVSSAFRESFRRRTYISHRNKTHAGAMTRDGRMSGIKAIRTIVMMRKAAAK